MTCKIGLTSFRYLGFHFKSEDLCHLAARQTYSLYFNTIPLARKTGSLDLRPLGELHVFMTGGKNIFA